MKRCFLQFFFSKSARKCIFMKKLIKMYLVHGHACAYHFSKIYIVCYRIRQENTKFTVLFPGKTMFKFKNSPKVNSPEWLVHVGLLFSI